MSSPPSVADTEPPAARSMPDADEWRDAIVEARPHPRLEQLFRRRAGIVPRMLPYVAPHSWVHRPLLYLLNPTLQALDVDLCREICFVVARDNACRYCYGSLEAFLRVAGYSAAELDRLERDLYLGDQGEETREALRFAVAVSRGELHHKPTVDTLQDAGYSLTAIREVAGNAVLVTITNRVATMLAVPIDEELEARPDPWYFDLLQPVVDTLLSGWQRLDPYPDRPLDPADADGPFARWCTRLKGTGAGRLLHDVIGRWYRETSALPRRTKLFVLAVVAHGLSRRDLEARVCSLLTEECGLAEDDVCTAVEHLRADVLRDQEEALLPLARDSIRYEAGSMQRSVRERTQDLTRAETIDAVAALGLSNALARLDALDVLAP